MRRSDNPRNKKLTIRLTDDEYEYIEQISSQRGVKMSSFVYELIIQNAEYFMEKDSLNCIENKIQESVRKEIENAVSLLKADINQTRKLINKNIIQSSMSNQIGQVILSEIITDENRVSPELVISKIQKQAVEDMKKSFSSYEEV